MPVKEHKATTPGQRHYVNIDTKRLDKKKPERRLVTPRKKKSGRNNQGRITARHRGGGEKQKTRLIDFRRDKDDVPATVAAIEYAPDRSAHVALLHYADGEKRYILAPEGLRKGDTVTSGENVPARIGNGLAIRNVPVGAVIHNVELVPGRGAQLGRSAGAEIRLLAKEGKYAHIQMPSGEVRLVATDCRCTIGRVGNVDHINVRDGKAGRSRRRGRRPHVRGSAMNAVAHPHGGGEGKAPIGMESPVSPWGKKTLGKKTRNRRKTSSKYIIRRRNEKEARG